MVGIRSSLVPVLKQLLVYFLQLVKQAILPRVHGLALKTTVAAVCVVYMYTASSFNSACYIENDDFCHFLLIIYGNVFEYVEVILCCYAG